MLVFQAVALKPLDYLAEVCQEPLIDTLVRREPLGQTVLNEPRLNFVGRPPSAAIDVRATDYFRLSAAGVHRICCQLVWVDNHDYRCQVLVPDPLPDLLDPLRAIRGENRTIHEAYGRQLTNAEDRRRTNPTIAAVEHLLDLCGVGTCTGKFPRAKKFSWEVGVGQIGQPFVQRDHCATIDGNKEERVETFWVAASSPLEGTYFDVTSSSSRTKEQSVEYD